VSIYNRVNVKAAFAPKEALIGWTKSTSRKSSTRGHPKTLRKRIIHKTHELKFIR
jgi:hypothetical protein